MKQVLVISGKGGTGKTVIAGAFAALAKNKVLADCDVDAADFHLLLKPRVIEKHSFKSGFTAVIDKAKCLECGRCKEVCRFEAVRGDFSIDGFSCEGCGFCSRICPAGAIEMRENICGEWFISETRFGPLVHAKLGVAEENSGKLVSLVRKQAKDIAETIKADWVVIDGSPGVGCPVIASLSGVDIALVVTEPTLSGLHDADRVIKLARHFKVPVLLVINKYDLNEGISGRISEFCQAEKVPLIGKIKFDEDMVKAVVAGKSIVEFSKKSLITQAIRRIWARIEEEVNG